MPTLIVQLHPDLAAPEAPNQQPRDLRLKALHDTLKAHQARLGSPLGSSGDLQFFHVIDASSLEKLDTLRAALGKLEGIDAAYIKPDDEAP